MTLRHIYAQLKVSMLGDTYSTFLRICASRTNLCWYGALGEKKENDVIKVDQTWCGWSIVYCMSLSSIILIRIQPFATQATRVPIIQFVPL